MSRQYFEDLPNEPLNIANSAVAFTTVIQVLFPNTSQIAIPAGDVRPGKVWRLTAGGIWTPPATGTLIVTPCWGTGTTVTLGPSGAATLGVPPAASAWWLTGLLMCRATGLAGTNSTMIAQGLFSAQGAIGTANTAIQVAFGGTASAACDPTAGGFQINMTFSVTGASMTPQIVCLQSLN